MITIRLPNSDNHIIEFNELLTFDELCSKISNQLPNNYINPIRSKLYFNGTLITSNQVLYEYGVTAGSLLEIIENFDISLPSNEILYDNYIVTTSPLPGEDNVSIDKQPTIHFKDNGFGLSLYLQSFQNSNSFRSDVSEGNIDEILGKEEAIKRGFRKWTDTTFDRHIFLLEVTNPNLEKTIESIRYDYYGINQRYHLGDRHSWQRYTDKLPIDCFIHLDEYEQRIRLIPELRLKQSTTYCILLQHGIPTTPIDELSSSLFSYTGKGICEDKVIIFRTQKSKINRVSMFG